jgi:uncharacterized integral membrane protein
MRIIVLLVSITLFFAVLGLAVKNGALVTLHYYLGMVWEAPLVVMLLIFFCVGVAAGVSACIGVIVRQRRQMELLRRELSQLQPGNVPGNGLAKNGF